MVVLARVSDVAVGSGGADVGTFAATGPVVLPAVKPDVAVGTAGTNVGTFAANWSDDEGDGSGISVATCSETIDGWLGE